MSVPASISVRFGLSWSGGFTLAGIAEALVCRIPTAAWSAAYDADHAVRDGAFVAELTGLLDLSGSSAGMRGGLWKRDE